MSLLRMVKGTGVVFLFFGLVACGAMNPENKYGAGFLPSRDGNTQSSNSDSMDYDAYQSNFMTIAINQVLYRITNTLSYVTLRGSCFNPGFDISSIYYRGLDQDGYALASDGYPYVSNATYYYGTSRLQPGNLKCRDNGTWETMIEIPTATLYQLEGGQFEVSMVVWYKNQELHNNVTGVAYAPVQPPHPENQNSLDSVQ